MPRKYTRRPKRITRRAGQFTEFDDFARVSQFVSVGSASVGTQQQTVQRIGSAMIGGDFTGNARGQNAVDIQIGREFADEVASGDNSVVFGARSKATQAGAVAIGRLTEATGQLSFALGSGAVASGEESVAVGSSAGASADDASAFGAVAVAAGARSVALGYSAFASSDDDAVISGNVLYVQTSDSAQHQIYPASGSVYDAAYVNVTGDTMTGALTITPTSNSTATFRVNNAAGSVLFVLDTTNQRVGIGTTPSTRQLTLTGDIRMSNNTNIRALTSGGTELVIFNTNGSDRIAYGDQSGWSGGMIFRPGTATDTLFLTQSARVGFGTQSPSGKMHVKGTSNQIQAIIQGFSTQTNNLTEWQDSSANILLQVQSGGHLQFADAVNAVFGATTGTIIGTATNQKLAFHNATPVIQRAGAAQAAVATTGATNTTPYGYTTAAQADALVTLVNEIRATLVEKGLMKGSA